MRLVSVIAGAAALISPASAFADTSAPIASERRLTPEQVEAVLAEAAAKRKMMDQQQAADGLAVPARVHGEVGFAIGTGGYREMYGTAIYPLGDNGFAQVSLDLVDWGNRRFRH